MREVPKSQKEESMKDLLTIKLERALGPKLVAEQKSWSERYDRECCFSWSFNGCWDDTEGIPTVQHWDS